MVNDMCEKYDKLNLKKYQNPIISELDIKNSLTEIYIEF